MKYTKKQIKALLDGIYDGSITEHALPQDLYFAITDYLKDGLYKGFGKTMATAEGPDLALLEELRTNVYMFGAAKTYQETKQISSFLIDEDGLIRSRSEFNKLGRDTFDTWNNDWGNSEYNTAIAQGQMSSKWNDIEAQKELFPKLRYSTIGDACDICGPLDGLVAPVDDPIWDDVYPANHFNCRCTVLQEDEDVPSTPDDEKDELYDKVVDKMDDTFINNAGKTGSVFTPEHPYFAIQDAERDFALQNFGLPIPKTDDDNE